MNINKNYKYFVVDTCDWLVVSGWEYKEDALDHLDELLEGIATAVTGDYKIYTTRYLNNKNINPFNNKNWIPGNYIKSINNKSLTKEDALETIIHTQEKTIESFSQQIEWFNSFVDAIQTWDHKLYNRACKYADEVEEGCM
jgi:hypothetical protein